MNKIYNLSVYIRIIVISLVLVISFLSILLGFPMAKLMGIDPSDFMGSNFQPTVKTLTVIVAFAATQFLLIWMVIRLIHKKSLKGLGFKGPILFPLLIGTGIGVLWQAFEYLLIHVTGGGISIALSIPNEVSVITMIAYLLLNVLFLLTLNSLKEELVFRTYPIEQFNDHPQLMIPVIVIVSLVFAAVHHILLPFQIDHFVSRFTIALVLSFVFYRWRSIWLISGLHNGLNLLNNLTSGNYKMGGLTDFTIANDPSKGMSIIIDFAVAIIFIIIFNYIWNKEKRNNKMFFKIKHPLSE